MKIECKIKKRDAASDEGGREGTIKWCCLFGLTAVRKALEHINPNIVMKLKFILSSEVMEKNDD